MWRLAAALGLPVPARLVAAAIFALNFHGINLAVLWISGRTALLLGAAAVWAADALIQGRPMLAGGLALVAMLSKEEAVVLPLVFAAWAAIRVEVDARRRGPGGDRRVLAGRAALVVYGLLRGRTTAMTFATAPGVYQARLDAGRFVETPSNTSIDRRPSRPLVTLAAGLIAWRWPRLEAAERRVLAMAAVWFAGMFAITVWLPVRSSLYA